jgi:hypothetical protein
MSRRSEDSSSQPRSYLSSKRKHRWYLGLGLFSIFVLFFLTTAHFRSPRLSHLEYPLSDFPSDTSKSIAVPQFVKPDNITIIAFVFFGRRNRVEMLRCYLERNLKENGGWLDEVHWVLNTNKESDLLYLEELLKTSDSYKKVDLTTEGAVGFAGFAKAWGHVERGKLYVKIDDDVVCPLPSWREIMEFGELAC